MSAPLQPERSAAREKVLIVEDEALVALDIEQRLVTLGFSVVGIADSATDALVLAREHRPDLVLMDIRIRGRLDGVDLARALATRFEVPVVFLTGNADEATLRRAIEAEPYGYVLKPFELRTLEATVRTALFRHRAERRAQTMRHWLADTLSSIPEAVVATDLQQRVSFLNRAAEKLLGVQLAEALLRPLAEVLGDARLEEAVGRVAAAAASAEPPVERFFLEWRQQRLSVAVSLIESVDAAVGVVVLLTAGPRALS